MSGSHFFPFCLFVLCVYLNCFSPPPSLSLSLFLSFSLSLSFSISLSPPLLSQTVRITTFLIHLFIAWILFWKPYISACISCFFTFHLLDWELSRIFRPLQMCPSLSSVSIISIDIREEVFSLIDMRAYRSRILGFIKSICLHVFPFLFHPPQHNIYI